uniref:Uncharacterized protein n=1 Tax=viral metagenome TaxID=1070528 RepID=A0A6H1ZAG0_9ZZZZ
MPLSEEERIAYTISVNAQEGITQLNAFLKGIKDADVAVDKLKKVISSFADITKKGFGEASSSITGLMNIYGRLGKVAQDAGQKVQQAGEKTQQAGAAIARASGETGKLGGAFSGMGNVAQHVFGVVFGITILSVLSGVVRAIKNVTKEAIQAGVDYLKVMYRMEVAAYALQRAGRQINFRDLVGQAAALQKAFPTFSKQQAMASVSYIALLTREFGFAEQQIKDVIKVSAVMAVIMGKDINEAAREVALTLSSGYSESLQRAGLNINRVVIQQEALRMGYKEGYQYLSGEVKAQAALNVVMRQLDPLYAKALEYYKTIPGEVDTARAAWQNYMTVLGASLAPFKEAWAEFWTDILNIAIEGTQELQLQALKNLAATADAAQANIDVSWLERGVTGPIWSSGGVLSTLTADTEKATKAVEDFRKAVKTLFPEGIPEADFPKWLAKGFSQELIDRINAAAFATGEFAEVVYTRLGEAEIAANKFGASLYLPMEQIEELKKKLVATDLILAIDTEQGKKDLAEFDAKVAADRKTLEDTLTGLGIDIDTGLGKKEVDDFVAYWEEQRRIFLLKTVLTLDTDEAKQKVAGLEAYLKSVFPEGLTAEAKLRLLFQGLTPSDIAKIEGMVGTVTVPVRVIPQIDMSGLLALTKSFRQTAGGGGGGGGADFGLQQQKALEDYNISLLREEEDFNRRLEDLESDYRKAKIREEEDFNRRLEELESNYREARAKEEQQFNKRLEELNTRYQDTEIKEEKRYQEQMNQLRERFLFDMEDALHERDARQIIRLARQYGMEKERAEREYTEGKTERELQFEEEKKRLREEHEERLQMEKKEYDLRRRRETEEYELRRQRKEEDYELNRQQEAEEYELRRQREEEHYELRRRRDEEDYKRRAATGSGQYKQDLKALSDAHDAQIKAIALAEAKKLGLSAQGTIDLQNLYLKYFGSNGLFVTEVGDSVELQILYFKLLEAEMEKIIGLYGRLSLGGGDGRGTLTGVSGGGYAGRRAKGGIDIANKPTNVTFGEAGPELAMFIPLNRPISNLPTNGAPSPVGGRIEIAVALSDGLEASIVNQSLNEVAAAITRTRRSKW